MAESEKKPLKITDRRRGKKSILNRNLQTDQFYPSSPSYGGLATDINTIPPLPEEIVASRKGR